jgi:hypothetical protein
MSRLRSIRFDGDGEPRDQPRNLVQMRGIMSLNGLRKPDQALVVAHRGYVARDDRGHRLFEISLDV